MKKDNRQEFNFEQLPLIPKKFQLVVVAGIMLLSLIVFFWGVIYENKTFIASDTIAGKSFETLVKDANEQGIFPLWNPYIFCGMPGYASLSVFGPRYFDISDMIINYIRGYFSYIFLYNCDIGYVFFYYFLFGIGVYLLVYRKLRNAIVALVAGLAVMHSTAFVVFIMIGHMTKVPVIAFLPYILIILEELEVKFRLWLTLLLVVLVHYLLKPTHLQMIFYSFFTIGIYFLYFLVRKLVKKENVVGLIRSAVVFVLASILAIGMTADQYLQTYEYSKYSIRGTSPILEKVEKGTEYVTEGGGLDYDYATSWSFSPSEMITFFIPSAYGFGAHHYQGILTQNHIVRVNTYFGPQPFVDAPQYMGVAILLLAILGFWMYRKEPFVQFMGIVILLSLLISFGKEFPLLYDLMFYYFPYFNKFRVPSMMLSLVQLFVPVLAAYGLHWLMKEALSLPDKTKKLLRRGTLIAAALTIFSFIAKDVFISIYQLVVSKENALHELAQSYGNNAMVIDELYKTVTSMVATDITVLFLLITIMLLIFIAFWNKKLSPAMLTVLLIGAVLFDLWRVNEKPKEMYPKQQLTDTFKTPDYVQFLLKNDTTLYRVLEFENGRTPYNNSLAYWRIQNAYGYHGAKMRQIQDVFDVVGLGNPLLWGLMNVKYIISNQPDSSFILAQLYKGSRYVYLNRFHLPRSFFVNRYEVATAMNILQNIKGMKFDPLDVAYVLEDLNESIEPPKNGAEVRYTRYGLQDLELEVTATGNNLLFISESWYPAGWKAYIDGKEIPIYRLNYMFRGLVVPEGTHKISMVFEPLTFTIGKTISLITNIIVLGGLLFYAVQWGIALKARYKKGV